MLLPALAAAAGRRQGRSAASLLSAMAMREGRTAAAAVSGEAPSAATATAIAESRRRMASSSSAADLLRRFADPRLQPPSIVRLPPALQQAHDAVSSSGVAGGPRRLGPLAASLAGRLASRSRSLGRGGASAAAWEGEEGEQASDDDDGGDGDDEETLGPEGGEEGDPISLEEGGRVLVLDLVAGGTARFSAGKDGEPLGPADGEALGWRRGGGGERKKRSKGRRDSSGGSPARSPLPARPAPPAYPDDATAAAYALARAPASFAATLHALLALRASGGAPALSRSPPPSAPLRPPPPPPPPLRVLDFGAGTGAAFLAAAAAFGGRGVEVVAVERAQAMASAGRRVVESLREAAAAAADELEISDDDDGSESGSESDGDGLPPFSPPRRVRWVRSLEEAAAAAAAVESSSAAEGGGGGEIDHYWRAKREAAEKKNKGEAAASPLATDRFDLVLAAFSLGESPDCAAEAAAVEALWELVAPGGALVVVEPGTPAGSLAVRAARDRVLFLPARPAELGGGGGAAAGVGRSPAAHVAAPCLHDGACPLASSKDKRTWCHFGQRLERSRAQRVAAASASAASAAAAAGGRGGGGRAAAAAASGGRGGGDDGAPPGSSSSSSLSRPAFSVSVSSHTDVRFAYVALVAAPRPERRRRGGERGGGGGGGEGREGEDSSSSSSSPAVEETVLARITRAPRPRSGHVLVGACFDPEGSEFPRPPPYSLLSSEGKSPLPSSAFLQLDLLDGNNASSSFGASVVTVTSSSKPKGAYRAARGARWGGVIALPASAVAKAAALDAKKEKQKDEA